MQIGVFGEILKNHDLQYGSGVPCSIFKSLVNYMTDDPTLHYLPATSEGEAVSIAAGLATAGKPAFALMQNSGLGNAVNPITSLLYIYDIPIMLLISHRGEPGKPDEPQHELMGRITQELATLCRLNTFNFNDNSFSDELTDSMDKGKATAWIFKKGALKGGTSTTSGSICLETFKRDHLPYGQSYRAELTREQALCVLLPFINQGDSSIAVVSTTGKLSRELYELDDKDHKRNNRFYMVGSMGCAAPFGLGIAQAEYSKARERGVQPRKVVVLDGDGALLMKMGALGTIGMINPKNFHHIIFDNGAYESTGGQPTCSPFVDIETIAIACGYKRTNTVSDKDEFRNCIEQHLSNDGPSLLRMLIRTGSRPDLGRPVLRPQDGWMRFHEFLCREKR